MAGPRPLSWRSMGRLMPRLVDGSRAGRSVFFRCLRVWRFSGMIRGSSTDFHVAPPKNRRRSG